MKKNKTLIILQARMSSKRLPFKSAALVASLPMAILCALRLSNKGHKLILATSKDASDDYLVELCNYYKINSFRGDLENVLKRFIQCTSGLSDETIIVRATADNPLNDGNIVSYAINQFKKNNLEYFNMPINLTYLPIGIGVEVVRLKKLREIYNKKNNNLDREHVTWKLAKNFEPKKKYYNKIRNTKKTNLRVTVDKIQDYFTILELFKNYKDPYKISWKKILNNKNKLNNFYKKFSRNNLKNKLILGGAQIGMDYGYKSEKKIKTNQLKKIFDLMEKQKINGIDTAQGYQLSEKKIGDYIKISNFKKNIFLFNKISEFTNISKIQNNALIAKIYVNIYLSMYNLKTFYIDVIMFHSVKNFLLKKELLKNILFDLKRKKLVGDFGISLYTPNDLRRVSKEKFFKFIQIPFNILDDRWNENLLLMLKKRYNFKIIARSIFLRGYLIHNKNWPKWFLEKKKLNSQMKKIKKEFNIKNNLQLCIKYVNSMSFIDFIVVGCNNLRQFKEILFGFRKRNFLKSEISIINQTIKVKNKNILDARNF